MFVSLLASKGTGSLAGTGIRLKLGTTVLEDGGNDQLTGDGDLDWFFLESSKDKAKDKASGERFN